MFAIGCGAAQADYCVQIPRQDKPGKSLWAW